MRPGRSLAALAVVAAALASPPALAQPPLQDLPAILHLQLSQHPAWRAYKDAVALGNADAAHDAGEAAILNGMTTPERLDAMRSRLDAQRGAFERQATATAAFYAALSPEQKRTFDAVTRAPEPQPPVQRPRTSAYARPPLPTPPDGAILPPPTR